MKRIAFISTNKSSWGGSEYLWYYTSVRLHESGIGIVTSIPRWKNIPEEINKLKLKKIEVKYNTDSSRYKKIFNRFLPTPFQFGNSDEGFKFLLDYKPDLTVINQGGNTGGIDLMEYCMKNNLRFVTISQAANEAKWPSSDLSNRLGIAFSGSLKNYFVSRANIKLTELQTGAKIQNAEVIFNPYNVDYDNEIKYPERGENYFLANVARHEIFAKGQDILFQVINENKWKERNLKVNLYGKGEHSSSISKLIKYFDLKNVNVMGHISTSEIWKRNHALILTSRYEGLPLALVEAMLCSRMGIVTSVSGNPEIVKDNEDGFLAKAAEVNLVDEALERAWDRRSEWEAIGKKARENIVKIIPKDPVGFFCERLLRL